MAAPETTFDFAGPPDDFDLIMRGVGQWSPAPDEQRPRLDARRRARRRRRVTTAVVMVVALGLIALGAHFVMKGLAGETVEEMPLPEETFAVTEGEAVTRAQEQAGDPDAGAEPPAGLEAMGPNQVWVPQLDPGLADARPDQEFVPSKYAGLPTLRIPSDPREAVWYSAGGPMWGGDEGTTLVAAHVATRKNPGVFRGIDKLQPGDVVWTTDADNRRQAWAVTQLWAAEHKAFPQEYFSAEGERRLVITTCGGRINAQGYYAQNVFLVAVPVTVPGSTVYEPAPQEQGADEAGGAEDVAEDTPEEQPEG